MRAASGELLRVLAVDTAQSACAACVIQAGEAEPLARGPLPMDRGHAGAAASRRQGRLRGRRRFESLDRVAVTIGPAAIRASGSASPPPAPSGFAAGVPVVGVATLSAFWRRSCRGKREGSWGPPSTPSTGRSTSRWWRQGADHHRAEPHGVRDTVRLMGSGPVQLTGSAAPMLASEAWTQGIEAVVVDAPIAPDIAGWAPWRIPPRPCRSRSTCAVRTPDPRRGADREAVSAAMSFLDRFRRTPPTARIEPLGTTHAARLSGIHETAFARAWGAFEFERLLADRSVLADGLFLGRSQVPSGFVLSRRVADEAEILTLAMAPEARGQGHGRLSSSTTSTSSPARACAPCISKWRRATPRRSPSTAASASGSSDGEGYYAKPDGSKVAALTMSATL